MNKFQMICPECNGQGRIFVIGDKRVAFTNKWKRTLQDYSFQTSQILCTDCKGSGVIVRKEA